MLVHTVWYRLQPDFTTFALPLTSALRTSYTALARRIGGIASSGSKNCTQSFVSSFPQRTTPSAASSERMRFTTVVCKRYAFFHLRPTFPHRSPISGVPPLSPGCDTDATSLTLRINHHDTTAAHRFLIQDVAKKKEEVRTKDERGKKKKNGLFVCL